MVKNKLKMKTKIIEEKISSKKLFFSLVAFAIAGVLIVKYFNLDSKMNLSLMGFNSATKEELKMVKASPESLAYAKKITNELPEETIEAEEAMRFFRNWLYDPAFSEFFAYTLDFFKGQKGAYAAARFVGLTMLFDESAENFYLMKWTKKELLDNSDSLMTFLESKKGEINVNPYFHSRMLNLAHQLDVAPERKVGFYIESMREPILLRENGDLQDSSLALEIALSLARQAENSQQQLAISLPEIIENSKDDPKVFNAMATRVLTYFPELSYLFQDVES